MDASFHPGGAGARTRKEQHESACVRGIVYKVFVSGKEAVRAVVRVARMQVWPGPQSAVGHWWHGAVRDPVWETEILAAVPPELPAEGNFRGLLFHGSRTYVGMVGMDWEGHSIRTPSDVEPARLSMSIKTAAVCWATTKRNTQHPP